jgi:hypothetical protein
MADRSLGVLEKLGNLLLFSARMVAVGSNLLEFTCVDRFRSLAHTHRREKSCKNKKTNNFLFPL